jgi:hypothetical protein
MHRRIDPSFSLHLSDFSDESSGAKVLVHDLSAGAKSAAAVSSLAARGFAAQSSFAQTQAPQRSVKRGQA